MKRFFAILLSAVMMLSLAACGSSTEETTKARTTKAETKAATEAATEAPRTTAASESTTEAPQPTTKAPETTEAPQPTTEVPQTTEAPQPTTEAPQPSDPAEAGDVDLDNTNYATGIGRVVHAYGGVWFVQKGMNNDGRTNGSPYSEDIYFLKDEEGAKPELVVSVPSDYTDLIQQITVYNLVPGPETANGRFIYFFCCAPTPFGNQYRLARANTAGGDVEYYDVVLLRGAALYETGRYRDRYYFRGMTLKELAENSYPAFNSSSLMVLDLVTGDCRAADFDYQLQEKEWAMPLGVGGEYLYYAVGSEKDDEVPYGIYRLSLEDRKVQEVAPITQEEVEAIFCSEKYIFIYCENEKDDEIWQVLDAESGEIAGEIPLDRFDDDCERALNLRGDTIYYFSGGALRAMDIDGSHDRQLIAGRKDRYPMLLFLCGQDIWFMDWEDYAMYRVTLGGRILPETPVKSLTDKEEYTKEKTEDVWIYWEFPECVVLRGYNGVEKEITLPAVLAGKPVSIVWMDLSESPVEKLTLPEGILSVRGLKGGEKLKEVWLPRSLENMLIRGWDYSFHLNENTEVHYNGTRAQWQVLYEYNRERWYVAVSSPKNPVGKVKCINGTWTRPE